MIINNILYSIPKTSLTLEVPEPSHKIVQSNGSDPL